MAKGQGFASLTPERRAEVSSKGGKTSQRRGTAHRFTSSEASVAGAKGGAGLRAAQAEGLAIVFIVDDDDGLEG